MFCALIMAGGKGTRFWPKSTEDVPKQFLNLIDSDETMIELTYKRLQKIMPKERIFVVTGKRYKKQVTNNLKDIPEKNIIIEPEGRNTAPCILLACLYIKQIYENATVAVLPSDHAIKNTDEFCGILEKANDYVENQNNEAIVTIGIMPDRPETGYGYIKFENTNDKVIKVEKFVEKPNLEKAKEYLADGGYLWNAGMFIFDINNMLKELKTNYSGYNVLEKLPKLESTDYESKINELYPECESISIDYAVMEKSKNIYVIKGNFGWDDIGTWNSLERYIPKDEENNVFNGNIVAYNSKNNVVYAGDKKVILLDAKDIFCIDTDNVLVIGNKESINKVHELRKK
ncbi:MAG: mannose-1-phosphate guanylyltransferase [Clostridia bacterium]|nr:mannose-1-phosphate guanylyltransferase [Clostridia bacterium]